MLPGILTKQLKLYILICSNIYSGVKEQNILSAKPYFFFKSKTLFIMY